MSRENVAIAERNIVGFNARDFDALAGMVTPDYQFRPAFPASVGSQAYLGAEDAEGFFRHIHDTWQEFRVTIDDHRDLGDIVLQIGRYEGRGRGSGASVSAPLWGVYEFRDGRIARFTGYLDEHEALKAVGLSE